MQYLTIGIRCLLGAVFLVSSVTKVAGPNALAAFVESVRGTRLLPSWLTRPVALLVVAAEFAAWVLLAVPFTAVAGLLVAAGLLVSFAVAVALAVRPEVRTPCRCFGASSAPLGARHVVRNVALTAAAAIGVATAPQAGPVHVGGLVVAVCAGLVLGALVTVLDDIVELFQPVNKDLGAARTLP
ncbi:MauE/DoxX family redox-associated membrane protein [Planosporangium sp. 12N6]|uniref:MauE/DoxX family redox-associated membrane protein n=1 Tax=Planosporangium spinosum TaxID=3402278 RepID=UPI003CEDE920